MYYSKPKFPLFYEVVFFLHIYNSVVSEFRLKDVEF